MKEKVSKILNSKFISRSKIVFIGVAISQLITFGTSFVITGYFTPEDLGLLGTLTALISIIAGTLSFKLEIAVIQSEHEDAVEVFLKSTFLSILASTLFCILCLFLPWDFAHKISAFFFPFLLWSWGYFIFFNSKQLPFKFDNLANVSWGVIWRSTFTLFFQLVGGILNPTFSWLLTGRITGDYVGALPHMKGHFREFKLKSVTRGWEQFFRRYSDFIFFTAPHHLCIALSNNIIIFFLEKSYGLVIVGFFALADRLIKAPLEVVGSTLFNVTIQRYGELKDNLKELKRFYSKVVALSLGVAIIIGAVIWIGIDFIIPLFGSKWAGASDMVKNLVPYFMSMIFITPTTNFLRFINKARLQLGIEVVEVGLKIVFLSLYQFQNSGEMVLGYSLLSLLFSFLKTGLVFKLITN